MESQTAEQNKKKGGCLKSTGIGCGIVIGLMLLGFAVAFLSCDLGFMNMNEMMQLREDLMAEFSVEDIGVSSNSTTINGKRINTLEIVLASPNIEPASDDSTRQFARRIAEAVVVAYPKTIDFDQIVIRLVKQSIDAGIFQYQQEYEFGFPVDDVLPETSPFSDFSDVLDQQDREPTVTQEK